MFHVKHRSQHTCSRLPRQRMRPDPSRRLLPALHSAIRGTFPAEVTECYGELTDVGQARAPPGRRPAAAATSTRPPPDGFRPSFQEGSFSRARITLTTVPSGHRWLAAAACARHQGSLAPDVPRTVQQRRLQEARCRGALPVLSMRGAAPGTGQQSDAISITGLLYLWPIPCFATGRCRVNLLADCWMGWIWKRSRGVGW